MAHGDYRGISVLRLLLWCDRILLNATLQELDLLHVVVLRGWLSIGAHLYDHIRRSRYEMRHANVINMSVDE